jgi:transposase
MTTKYNLKTKKKKLVIEPMSNSLAEVYGGPPPPARGRIIGLDCHPDVYTAAVFRGATPHDARKLSCREDLSLQRLLEWVTREFTSEDLFLMEAGSNSFEVYRRLLALGMRAVVLESAYVGKHAKAYADDDKMAAARIVLVYLGAKVPCVWVPDALTCERRELLHAYEKAVSDHTAAVNSLTGYLNQFTIRRGDRSLLTERTHRWILAQRDWSSLQRELLEDYFSQLRIQDQRRKSLLRLIAREVASEPLMLRCMKLLGIATLNAFALLAVIGDVRRFERPGKLVAYIGLNPGQRKSGKGKRIKVPLGRRGRADMRRLLIQGAQAVMRSGAKTAIGRWGWKLFARKGVRNMAVSAIARKMLVQVWHLLSGNPPTALDPDKSLTLKLKKLAVVLGKSLRNQLGLPPTLDQSVLELLRRMQPSPT